MKSPPFEAVAALISVSVPLLIYRSFTRGTEAGFGLNWEQMAIARSLVAGHGFGNPFGAHATGPTAAYAPVHPLILAAIISVFGDRSLAAAPTVLVEVAIQVAALALLLRLSALLFSSWIPGAIGAAAMLLCTRPLPQWENATAWLAIEVIFVLLIANAKARWTGLAMGVGWLVSPALAPASLAAVLILRGWKPAARCASIAALVIAPWMIRNWTVFHAPVFLRDNFGLELFISNNDRAGPRQMDARERYEVWHPSQNEAAAAELVRVGEPRYFGRLESEAIRWARAHPSAFLKLTLERIYLWWASTWIVAALNCLGLVGVWLNRSRSIGKATALAFLVYPLPYYFVQFDPRYTWPVLWLAALMAGFCLLELYRATRESSYRLVVGLEARS